MCGHRLCEGHAQPHVAYLSDPYFVSNLGNDTAVPLRWTCRWQFATLEEAAEKVLDRSDNSNFIQCASFSKPMADDRNICSGAALLGRIPS